MTLALETFEPHGVTAAGTVLILHGGGQSRREWREVAQILAGADLRVVTMDLRGHGESDWSPSLSYVLEDYVADVELVIDDLVGPVVVVGHSHGGKVALVTAGRREGDLAGLVMIDSLPDMEPDWPTNDFFKATANGFADPADAARALGEHLGRPITTAGLERGLRQHPDGRWRWSWDTAVLDGVANNLDHDRAVMREAASRITLPSLLLRTEESQFLDDDNVARLLSMMPRLEVRTLPGTQHHRPWQHSQQLADRLSEFVAFTKRSAHEVELLERVDSVEPLFEPFRLADLELSSRFVMAPMTRNFSPGGLPGTDVADYYVRRSRSVGLIISEGIYVPHPSAGTYADVPELSGPEAVAAWRRVTDRVHEGGGLIMAQLWHVGAVRRPGKPPVPDARVVSPSGMDLRGRVIGDALRAEEIEAIVQAYATAAARAMDAGFDGIEIHAAHGYLIDEFHWSATNRRNDRFGGDIRARSTLGALVTSAVRAAVGPGVPISYRFSQWKLTDYAAQNVTGPEELAQWLQPVVEAGADVLHASTRRYWTPAFEGSSRTLAGWAKHLTGLPVIGVGSVGVRAPFRAELDEAESLSLAPLVELVQTGELDLIAVGRAVVSDAEWPLKVREGRASEIRWYRKEHEAVLD